MAISVRILPRPGLVYVRYSGRISLDETEAAFKAYLNDPDYRPGQKQLIDLSDVTDWERDFAKLMELQARKAEAFYDLRFSTLMVAIAPSDRARKVADFVSRSWDEIDSVAYLVAESHEHALHLLGLSADHVPELFPSS